MNTTKNKVALFIPTYNVEKSIINVLNAIPDDYYDCIDSLYIIDNQSTDNTVKLLKEYRTQHKKIKIFLNTENYTLGGSTVLAFDQAIKDNIDYLICMHSDGQADPKFLLEFNKYTNEDHDFILGSRFLKDSDISGYSSLRYLFNMLFTYLQWLTLKQRVYDIGAFIGFNMNTIQQIPYRRITADMGYHPYLIMCANHYIDRKLKFVEFPISWGKVEGSNINVLIYGTTHLGRIIKVLCGFISLKTPSYETTEL